MITVIIAGGMGTRLWPLSTSDYPKHLLKVNDETDSLLQKSYNRIKPISDKIYVITDHTHAEHVRRQLPELDEKCCIVEPGRRGTASCILAALVQIKRDNDPDEPIAFIPADHYVRDIEGFRRSFELASQVSYREGSITLVGLEPSYPATGFGYIEKDELLAPNSFVFHVASFKEKPDYETAQDYLVSGNYLWNCGYFVGTAEVFEQAMEKFAPDLFANYKRLADASAESYKDTYLSLENVSIDYALIEKTENLLVVPAEFDWMDLGSYSDLHKASHSDEHGNYTFGNIELDSVQNSYIYNQEDKPIALIGLDNVAVVNTPDGIIITRKDLDQEVGKISKKIGGQ